MHPLTHSHLVSYTLPHPSNTPHTPTHSTSGIYPPRPGVRGMCGDRQKRWISPKHHRTGTGDYSLLSTSLQCIFILSYPFSFSSYLNLIYLAILSINNLTPFILLYYYKHHRPWTGDLPVLSVLTVNLFYLRYFYLISF